MNLPVKLLLNLLVYTYIYMINIPWEFGGVDVVMDIGMEIELGLLSSIPAWFCSVHFMLIHM